MHLILTAIPGGLAYGMPATQKLTLVAATVCVCTFPPHLRSADVGLPVSNSQSVSLLFSWLGLLRHQAHSSGDLPGTAGLVVGKRAVGSAGLCLGQLFPKGADDSSGGLSECGRWGGGDRGLQAIALFCSLGARKSLWKGHPPSPGSSCNRSSLPFGV